MEAISCRVEAVPPARRRRGGGAFPSENRCVDVEKLRFSL